MSQVHTQVPQPPSGVPPTEIPLSITAPLSETPFPVNLSASQSYSVYSFDHGIYIKNYRINNSQVPGSKIATWFSRFPLGLDPNVYNTVSGIQKDKFFVPWNLVSAFYARTGKIEWDIILAPVKVADSRVILDVLFRYAGDFLDVWDRNTLANDNLSKLIDSSDNNFEFNVPLFHTTNFYHMDSHVASTLDNSTSTVRRRFINASPFIPNTSVNLFIRNRYHNSKIQPSKFDLAFIVRPKIKYLGGFAGRSIFPSFGLAEGHISRPYFLWNQNP